MSSTVFAGSILNWAGNSIKIMNSVPDIAFIAFDRNFKFLFAYTIEFHFIFVKLIVEFGWLSLTNICNKVITVSTLPCLAIRWRDDDEVFKIVLNFASKSCMQKWCEIKMAVLVRSKEIIENLFVSKFSWSTSAVNFKSPPSFIVVHSVWGVYGKSLLLA